MNAVTDVLEAVKSLIDSAGGITSTIGALPTGEGLSVNIAQSADIETHLDRSRVVRMPVTINIKNASQKTAFDTLATIGKTLSEASSYPKGAQYRICDISWAALPTLIERDERGLWLYASSITVRFYLGKEL